MPKDSNAEPYHYELNTGSAKSESVGDSDPGSQPPETVEPVAAILQAPQGWGFLNQGSCSCTHTMLNVLINPTDDSHMDTGLCLYHNIFQTSVTHKFIILSYEDGSIFLG